MKITEYALYRFTLPLKQPFRAGALDIAERAGLLLQLKNETGLSGLGEIMPLPGWHAETVDQCEAEIKSILWALKGFAIPDNLEELSGGFASWYTQLSRNNIAPSVCYGYEAATLHLLANARKCSIAELISDSPRQIVSVNALVNGPLDEITKKVETSLAGGFRAFKLKVGKRSIKEDAQIAQSVRKQIGNYPLRLDANCSWSLSDAIQFLHSIEDCNVEYIEEPLQNSNQLHSLHENVPLARIALDESLMNMTPEQLEKTEGVTAIILKSPMFGVENTMRFARRAQSLGMTPVISSPFESGVGLSMSVALTASINTTDIAAGLESYQWLADDLLQPRTPITNGQISLADCHVTPERINWLRLEQIV